MTQPVQPSKDEIQRRLEDRPRVTLRFRITLVFVICAVFITGVTAGEKKTVNIPFMDAYGDVNPQMVADVPKDRVPEGIEVGQMLQTMTPQGPMNVLVKEVHDDHVVLDANHPLAGKDLIFDLELISVE